jgi:hypothetical protein
MASIASALRHIKDNPLSVLDRSVVERVCRENHYDGFRHRELDPATTVALFLQQVVHGNTPCGEVRYLATAAGLGRRFSPQAWCEARARLPLDIYRGLAAEVCDALVTQPGQSASHLWRGHRTFHIDGSTFSMPDTRELRAAFGTPSGQAKGCGFPTAHLLALFSATTGVLLEAIAAPMRSGDLIDAPDAHLSLQPGDILIGDDMFGGYAHLALLAAQGIHGLFPVHHRRIVDFTKGRPHGGAGSGLPRSRWIRSLGREDQLVEYAKEGPKAPAWMPQSLYDELPDTLVVRELRRTVVRPGLGKITLALTTTLTDPLAYPAADLLELRLRRWDVETDLRHLKTTMGLDVLRCHTEQGVLKELAVFCLVYNLVRAVMLTAAGRQGVPVSRVSFADAYHWMRHARPGEPLPPLIVNPHRPDRVEPRCIKRRPKQYDLMSKPRDELRKLLKNKRKRA